MKKLPTWLPLASGASLILYTQRPQVSWPRSLAPFPEVPSAKTRIYYNTLPSINYLNLCIHVSRCFRLAETLWQLFNYSNYAKTGVLASMHVSDWLRSCDLCHTFTFAVQVARCALKNIMNFDFLRPFGGLLAAMNTSQIDPSIRGGKWFTLSNFPCVFVTKFRLVDQQLQWQISLPYFW